MATASAGSTTGALPNACALLTDSQVTNAMGQAIGQRRGDPPTPALSLCQWDGTSAGQRYVHLTIRTAQSGTGTFNNSYKARADGQAVAGIGTEAIAIVGSNTPNDYRLATMAALTSQYYIQVNIASANRSDGDALAALTTAMRAVVAALPSR
jgi:hypothetical protein